ncbi:MAG: threonine synthase, partial [Halobacteriota archaeon]
MDHHLACQRCGARFDPGDFPVGCPACREDGDAGRLEVVPEPDSVSHLVSDPDERSMWRYRHLLPLVADEPITLGEGYTPLVGLSTARLEGDRIEVLLKNETGNPSWSYKDRLNAMLVSNATHFGRTHFVTSSTGNHGASTAAYAARAGAKATLVFLHPAADAPHRVQLRAYGAAVATLEDEARQRLLREFVDRGWYPTVNVPDAYVGLPYAAEGYKTIAFE